ncbi:hypothetical protein MMC10_002681 [Thelotrema lepadinum]|nr:hypothetical protein [Thelotrema lepadinum]
METIWQIGLAETNRRRSKRRVKQLKEDLVPTDIEKATSNQANNVRCMASVVGYREEPGLFTKCLESYRNCSGLEIMLIGIDGNGAQDMEMANIARKVFPKDIQFIGLQEPLADVAVRLAEEYALSKLSKSDRFNLTPDWIFNDLPLNLRLEAKDYAMHKVYAKAAEILREHKALDSYENSFRALCVYQPHVSKKGIMFTNLIFSSILGQANDISYLWTSDSDTWVTPETLPLTIGCMESDPMIGGSCSSLSIHNENDSFIAGLGSAAYWSELAITRGQTGAIDAVDCQPGPCAAFQLSALTPNLFDWYMQTSLGVKTIVNEDRHLTTKLLLAGWRVTFNTEAIAFTDTPTTLLRWLLQQIRWARANQIETFQYPQVYAIHGPILFITAMNRFYGPLSIMVVTARYVLHGDSDRAYSLIDVFLRIALCTTYNFICNRRHVCSWAFLAISQIFYQLPLPGIIVYSTATALEGGWGTSMRNRTESQKAKGGGWEHLRSVSAVVAWMALVAAAVARYTATAFAPAWRAELMVLSAVSAAGVLVKGVASSTSPFLAAHPTAPTALPLSPAALSGATRAVGGVIRQCEDASARLRDEEEEGRGGGGGRGRWGMGRVVVEEEEEIGEVIVVEEEEEEGEDE